MYKFGVFRGFLHFSYANKLKYSYNRSSDHIHFLILIIQIFINLIYSRIKTKVKLNLSDNRLVIIH